MVTLGDEMVDALRRSRPLADQQVLDMGHFLRA
jgi:hypothetical protein